MAATAIDYAPKTKIRLGGFLGKKYGKHHHFLLERGDAKEAAKALDANYPGFARDLADAEGGGLASRSSRTARILATLSWTWAVLESCGLCR